MHGDEREVGSSAREREGITGSKERCPLQTPPCRGRDVCVSLRVSQGKGRKTKKTQNTFTPRTRRERSRGHNLGRMVAMDELIAGGAILQLAYVFLTDNRRREELQSKAPVTVFLIFLYCAASAALASGASRVSELTLGDDAQLLAEPWRVISSLLVYERLTALSAHLLLLHKIGPQLEVRPSGSPARALAEPAPRLVLVPLRLLATLRTCWLVQGVAEGTATAYTD